MVSLSEALKRKPPQVRHAVGRAKTKRKVPMRVKKDSKKKYTNTVKAGERETEEKLRKALVRRARNVFPGLLFIGYANLEGKTEIEGVLARQRGLQKGWYDTYFPYLVDVNPLLMYLQHLKEKDKKRVFTRKGYLEFLDKLSAPDAEPREEILCCGMGLELKRRKMQYMDKNGNILTQYQGKRDRDQKIIHAYAQRAGVFSVTSVGFQESWMYLYCFMVLAEMQGSYVPARNV